ncbi:MAG TPA: hypothetical protein VFQ61_11730 [Polyangiaceae bacterium]|nr:hypothetical protein [Polyangiaceae bacterium]
MLRVKRVALESFGIEPFVTEDRMILRLSGTGDMVAVEPLKDCLDEARKDIARLSFKSLEVDIRALYLLNSSCIKALVRFIFVVQQDGPKFGIRFLVDKNLTWQARALSALTRMAPDLVTIAS